MIIYLAGAIDGVSKDDARDWREVATSELNRAGLGTYDPAAAFSLPLNYAKDGNFAGCARLIDINTTAVRFSMAVLANLTKPSYGTSVETWLALTDFKIPVFSWGLYEQSVYSDLLRVSSSYHDAVSNLIEWAENNPNTERPVLAGFDNE